MAIGIVVKLAPWPWTSQLPKLPKLPKLLFELPKSLAFGWSSSSQLRQDHRGHEVETPSRQLGMSVLAQASLVGDRALPVPGS